MTITRATDRGRFRGPSTVIETVQLLPSEEMAHNLFLDMSGMRHGDLVLKTTQLGDESQVVAWKPDDTSGFRATFRQLAISARRSNAIVTVVLVPGTRLDYGVRLASMMFGCLR